MNNKSLVDVSLDRIPEYLRQGEYFRSLSDNDNGDSLFTVPRIVLKPDPSIADVSDLEHLLLSLQFWIACNKDHRQSIVTFLLSAGFGEDVHQVVEEYRTAFPFLHATWMALTMDPVMLSKRYPTPLVLYVLDHHPAAVDILLLLSEHKSLQNRSGDTDQHNDQVRSFLKSYCIDDVAENGDLEMLKLLYGGDSVCLPHMVEEGFSFSLLERVPPIAASFGHAHILRYLYSINSKLIHQNSSCALYAAEKGNLDCLQFFLSVGGRRLPGVASRAAQGGHLHCLQFAHEHGYRWYANTCAELRATAI